MTNRTRRRAQGQIGGVIVAWGIGRLTASPSGLSEDDRRTMEKLFLTLA